LEELLGILETSGYELSIEQVLEIQSVLLSSAVTSLRLKDLKFLITPIIAKNDEDQKNLYKIIDTYISERIRSDEEEEQKPPGFLQRILRNRMLVFYLKVAGFLLLVAAGIVAYLLNEAQSERIVKAEVAAKKKSVPPLVTNPDPTTGQQEYTPKTNSLDQPAQPTLEMAETRSPIIPEPYSYNLQTSLIFGIPLGIILAYFIFYEKRRRMEMQKKSRLDSGALLSGEREKEIPGITEQNVPDRFEQIVLDFPDKNYLIQKSREFFGIRSNLKKLALTDEERFDVKRSIYQTSRNAGFTSVVFSSKPKERKYLFLTDDKYPDAHSTQLLKYLVNTVSASKVPVKKYSYTNDIGTVKDVNGNVRKLQELAHDYPDHHLIIVGDCHFLFSDDNPVRKKNCMATLQKWSSRSVITVLPFPDWSYAEIQLQENKFHMVPAEIGAVELLTKTITEHSVIKKGKIESTIRDMYTVSNIDFGSVDALRYYLGNEQLFQVICSLAIYPKLKWAVTLALFSAIVKNDPKSDRTVKIDYDTLLKISRIPWLYRDELEPSIRLSLLNQLHPRTEVIARERILRLLQDIRPDIPAHSLAFRELELQHSLNSFFLFAHDPHKYKKYAESKKEISHQWNDLREWALKERTNIGQSGLMPLDDAGKHVTVEEFLLQEKEFEKMSVNFYKIVLVTLPSILLYILFSITRPNLVYPIGNYKSVSFNAVIQGNGCLRPDTAFVLINGSLDTLPLQGRAGGDTLRIRDIRYDGTVILTVSANNKRTREVLLGATDSLVVVFPRCR
jgi:hypothetical protein